MCQVHTGAYVSLLAPGKIDYTACRPRKTNTYVLHVVPITTHTHDRRKSIGNKKQRKEDKDIVCGYVAAFEIRIKRGLSIVLHDTSGIPRKQLPESEKTKFHFVPLLVVFLGTRGTHRSTHSTRRNTAVRGCQTEMSLSLDCCCTVTVTK